MLVSQILQAQGRHGLHRRAPPKPSRRWRPCCIPARRRPGGARRPSAWSGIVSERDIVRVVAEGGAAALGQPVSGCMTRDVLFAEPGETVDSLLTPDDRPAHPPPAGLPEGAAGGHRLHRRPGEDEDLRGRGRGRRAEGLYRRRAEAERRSPARGSATRSAARRPGCRPPAPRRWRRGARAAASRRVQSARSGQSSHLRKPRRGLTQGASARGPSITRITSAKLISAAGAGQDIAAELAAPADHQAVARQLQQDGFQELARRVGAQRRARRR